MRRLMGGPWLRTALWLLTRLRRAWSSLEPVERRRAGELVTKSRGRPRNLSPKERAELRLIFAKARAKRGRRRLFRRRSG